MRLAPIAALLLLCACAQANPDAARLKADLLGPHSATEVLTQWCAGWHLAAPAVIHAMRDKVMMPASAETRALLKVTGSEAVGYRRVKLVCGAHVLSEADNWYVPARLTPAMNQTLDTTDTSFGTVVKPLGFHRRTLDADPARGRYVLKVRALLLTPDGTPFSLVVENYTSELAAPP